MCLQLMSQYKHWHYQFEAEHGFPHLKLVKANLRTKLGQYSLNNCLAIKLLSHGITQSNPTESMHH